MKFHAHYLHFPSLVSKFLCYLKVEHRCTLQAYPRESPEVMQVVVSSRHLTEHYLNICINELNKYPFRTTFTETGVD